MTGARTARSGIQPDGFRWRGGEITRVEGFSDAVFAFAITLLVVSLEVPRTFHELVGTMRGFLAFGVCFALLIIVWREHYVFFRRYALEDATTLWLNAALLFVTLFYVYPLKFVFRLVFAPVVGDPTEVPAPGGGLEPVIRPPEVRTLFLIYGAGLAALYLLLALLYAHALRRRRELDLTPVEVFDTRSSIVAHLLAAGIGAVSMAIAVLAPLRLVGLAGFAYFLFAPVMAVHGSMSGARRRRVAARHVP